MSFVCARNRVQLYVMYTLCINSTIKGEDRALLVDIPPYFSIECSKNRGNFFKKYFLHVQFQICSSWIEKVYPKPLGMFSIPKCTIFGILELCIPLKNHVSNTKKNIKIRMKQNRTFSLSFLESSNAMYPKASLGRIENDVGPNSKIVIFYMVYKDSI